LLVVQRQPGKSTFTTVREFVENSLDAAEEGNYLPDIHIRL
jgi:DNA topoisomerase VI subunit B